MAAVLLDSSVLIDLLRGHRGARQRLQKLKAVGDLPHICAVNVDEIARGTGAEPERRVAERLVEGMRMVPLGAHEGWLAGSWRREFGSRGLTLAQGDCLIAAAAATIGGRLATGNPRHFPMPELTVEHWPAGA
ncbi:MAG: PIN domain-containing protein [Actinobacteria bacterium]|nr:PIN domain-containing protein [Actinomycetota bacterium]